MHLPHLPSRLSRSRNLLNLHLFDEDWKAALAELERRPHEARNWSTRTGFFDGEHESHVLPIHLACSLRAPLEVIEAIVEAYPACLSKPESSFKRLPLHVACQFDAAPEVVEYLARTNAASTLEADALGRLPLHYVACNGARPDVLQSLLRVAGPASALYGDRNRWIPLHVAVHFGASTEAVKALIVACPSSACAKTRKGNTAVELARKVEAKNRDEVVALLECAVKVAGGADGNVAGESNWNRPAASSPRARNAVSAHAA